MKNYLIAGFLFAIPINLFGMFLGIQELERLKRYTKDSNNYKEMVYIQKMSADKANFVFSLSSITQGRFFGSNQQNLGDVIVTISESDDKTKAKTTIIVEKNASLEKANDAVKAYVKEWLIKRENFVELFFGKDKQQLDKNVAESKAERFYKGLKDVDEDDELDVDSFIQSLLAQLAPKLEELAHALKLLVKSITGYGIEDWV